MYSALSFDELNQMDMNTRSIPYEKYFGEMELPKEEKETRIKLAENMEDEFLYVMSLMFTLQKYPTPNWETARQEFFDRYKKSLNGYVTPNENFLAYMTALSYEVILMILIIFHRIEQNLFLRMKAMYQEVFNTT